jgi:hypothetical protein
MEKFGSVVSFGPPCTKMPRILWEGVQDVKIMVTSV